MSGQMPNLLDDNEDRSFLLEEELAPGLSQDEITRQAVLSSIVAGEELASVVRQELEISGVSSSQRQYLLDAHNQAIEHFKATDVAGILDDPNLSPEDKAASLKKASELIQFAKPPSMLDLAMEKSLSEAIATDADEEKVRMSVAEHYNDIRTGDLALLKVPELIQWSRSTAAGQIGDFALGAFAPGFGPNVMDVINEASPGFMSWTEGYIFGVGGAIADYKEYLRSLPGEQREREIRNLVNAINNNKFYGTASDWVKFDLASTILDDLHDEGWEIALNNAFQLLDWVPGLYTLVRRGGRVAAKTLSDTAEEVFEKAGKDALSKMPSKVEADAAKAAETGPIESTVFLPKPVSPEAKTLMEQGGKHTDLSGPVLARARQELDNALERLPHKSVLNALSKVAPAEARALGNAVLQDPTGAMAKGAGATREQVTSTSILPKQSDEPVRPDIELNEPYDTQTDILYRDYSLGFLTDDELDAMKTSSDVIMRGIAAANPNVLLSKMQVQQIPGGYAARYYVSKSNTTGFSSLKDAEATAKTFAEYDKATSRILIRKYGADEYVPVEQARKEGWLKPGSGEYIVEFDVLDLVSPSAALANTKFFKPNSIIGKTSAWLDKSSVFQDWLVRAGNIAADAESAKVKALVDIMRPMTSLSEALQAKVIKALDEGDRYVDPDTGAQGKWFTVDELGERWRDEKHVISMIAGYQSVVRHQQAVRKLINDSTRRRLDGEGYKHISFNTLQGRNSGIESMDHLAKYVSRKELKRKDGDDIAQIYDAKSGKVIDVDSLALDALDDATGVNKFIKFSKPIKIEGKTLSYAVLRNGEGLRVKALPKDVIKDIPGYISRIYDAPYILKLKYKTIKDGVEETELGAVRMYATKGEAERDRAAMQASANEGDEYIVAEARELREDLEYANRSSLEYLENSGQLFTSHRGLEVRGIDGKRRLRSVADSISAARARAARAGTIDLLVDKLIKNWETRYGEKYGVKGRMPMRSVDVRKNTQDVEEHFDYNEAIALQRHIMTIAGVDDTMFADAMRNFMITFADKISVHWDNTLAAKVSEWGYKNRNRNPVNAIKGAAFTHFIIFNPLRQLFLQSQQATVYLGLEHGLKYFMAGPGIRDYAGLIHGSMFNGTKEWPRLRKQFARAVGMDETEYERLVRAYNSTGMNASVDTHMYAVFSDLDRELNASTGLQRAAAQPWRLFNLIRKTARTVGFDAGEKFQLMGAFLAVRNKWIKNNPKKAHLWDQPKNLEEIMGQTRAVSFNMNKTGVMQFQKGVLGAMFQFMSHATKSLQVLIPDTKLTGKLANKAFTNAEKRRIMAYQFALYGMGGFGIHEMFEKSVADLGIEVPPEVMSYINEGITGSMLNMMFAAADEEGGIDTDLEISSTVAPFSGIGGRSQIVGMGNPAGALLDAILISDKTLAEFLGGPGVALNKKVKDAINFTGAVIGAQPPTRAEPGNTALIVDAFAKALLPAYNNFVRGRLMATYDAHIANSGNEGVEVSEGEALAMTLLGTQSRRQRQVSEALITLRGLPGHPQEESLKKELDDAAASWVNVLKRRIELSGGLANPEMADTQSLIEVANLNAEAMRMILADDEYNYFFRRVQDRLNGASKDKGTSAEFVQQVISLFKAEHPHVHSEEFSAWLNNLTPFEGKDQLIEIIEEMK